MFVTNFCIPQYISSKIFKVYDTDNIFPVKHTIFFPKTLLSSTKKKVKVVSFFYHFHKMLRFVCFYNIFFFICLKSLRKIFQLDSKNIYDNPFSHSHAVSPSSFIFYRNIFLKYNFIFFS